MLRFLAFIARACAFDHTSLNADLLFGHALVTDFVDESAHHVKPTRRRNQAQRDQTFIHDADGLGETDLGRSDLSRSDLCNIVTSRQTGWSFAAGRRSSYSAGVSEGRAQAELGVKHPREFSGSSPPRLLP